MSTVAHSGVAVRARLPDMPMARAAVGSVLDEWPHTLADQAGHVEPNQPA